MEFQAPIMTKLPTDLCNFVVVDKSNGILQTWQIINHFLYTSLVRMAAAVVGANVTVLLIN